MSQAGHDSKDNYFRPQPNLDADLQRELDEALGDMSIDDLIAAEEGAAAPAPAAKGVRRGRVVSVQGDDIFVDLGGKSQGILPASQFADEALPAEGDYVDVTIAGYDNKEGLLMLSRQGAVLAVTWERINEGQVVEARVTDHNKGGLEVSVNGVRAFMPISQIELFRVEDLTPYVGRVVKCQVMEVDEDDHKVIVSRRAVLEIEAQAAREQMYESLKEGDIVRGVVRSIMPYGAFVDIGGVDGLVHVSDMSHTRVDDPKTLVKEGQALDVKVLKVDRENRRISLGIKQVMPDPWLDADKKYTVDTIVTGRITRLADFGAFLELEAGVEGLIPISEMTFERRIKHPSEIVKTGDMAKVRVLSMDLERKRISLSLKRVGDDPWMGASTRWPEGTVIKGVVKRVAEFGAFVEITSGVEGLVHISELSSTHVRAVSDVVKEGELVEAKVVSVDEERRRIGLSIKQLQTSAEYTGPATAHADTAHAEAPKPQTKRKRPLKGGLE